MLLGANKLYPTMKAHAASFVLLGKLSFAIQPSAKALFTQIETMRLAALLLLSYLSRFEPPTMC